MKNYVLEYSDSQSAFHVQTSDDREKCECKIRSDYNVIFTGTYDECFAEYMRLIDGELNG